MNARVKKLIEDEISRLEAHVAKSENEMADLEQSLGRWETYKKQAIDGIVELQELLGDEV